MTGRGNATRSRGSGPSTVSRTSARRFAARARARRLLTLRPLLAAALVVASLITLAWLLLGSGLLAVRHVQVVGVHRLTADQVRTAAEIADGSALLTLDTGAVARRVEGLPAVARVEVTRRWPSTVRLTVVERTAAVGVPQGGKFLLLDALGVPFATVGALPPHARRLEVAHPAADDPTTRAALEVYRALPASVLTRVTTLRASSPDDVRLVLRNGAAVIWGSADQSGRKAQVLAVLIKQRAKVYDVSSPDVVTTS